MEYPYFQGDINLNITEFQHIYQITYLRSQKTNFCSILLLQLVFNTSHDKKILYPDPKHAAIFIMILKMQRILKTLF